MVPADGVIVYLTSSIFTIQERLQQRINEHHGKSLHRMNGEKLLACASAQVKAKIVEVMRIMLDNRLEVKEEHFSQCGK